MILISDRHIINIFLVPYSLQHNNEAVKCNHAPSYTPGYRRVIRIECIGPSYGSGADIETEKNRLPIYTVHHPAAVWPSRRKPFNLQ